MDAVVPGWSAGKQPPEPARTLPVSAHICSIYAGSVRKRIWQHWARVRAQHRPFVGPDRGCKRRRRPAALRAVFPEPCQAEHRQSSSDIYVLFRESEHVPVGRTWGCKEQNLMEVVLE